MIVHKLSRVDGWAYIRSQRKGKAALGGRLSCEVGANWEIFEVIK